VPRSVVAAVDVGGTGMKGVLVDDTGAVVASAEAATPVVDGPDAVVAAVREFVRALSGRDPDVRAAGLVVPGFVDPDAGIARYSANIGWRDVPLRELVAADLRRPVVLEHDVRAAALAETTLGAARDTADAAIIVIGTGIAAVLISAGRVIRGAIGLAGELGHIPVRPGGEPCACGQRGCLETYASARAIARRYVEAGGDAVPAHVVVERIGEDALAARVWDDAVDTLADAVVTTTMIADPTVVVIGGGLAEAGETLLAPLRRAVGERLTWRPPPRIERSPLGPRAGRFGAAVLAWQAVGGADFARWTVR
jgi:glucokinase